MERGEFYMIGDNPARFNIKEMIRHRMEGILSMAPPVPYWSAGSRFDPRVSEIGGVQQAAAELTEAATYFERAAALCPVPVMKAEFTDRAAWCRTKAEAM